jgi:hypothetical protein
LLVDCSADDVRVGAAVVQDAIGGRRSPRPPLRSSNAPSRGDVPRGDVPEHSELARSGVLQRHARRLSDSAANIFAKPTPWSFRGRFNNRGVDLAVRSELLVDCSADEMERQGLSTWSRRMASSMVSSRLQKAKRTR